MACLSFTRWFSLWVCICVGQKSMSIANHAQHLSYLWDRASRPWNLIWLDLLANGHQIWIYCLSRTPHTTLYPALGFQMHASAPGSYVNARDLNSSLHACTTGISPANKVISDHWALYLILSMHLWICNLVCIGLLEKHWQDMQKTLAYSKKGQIWKNTTSLNHDFLQVISSFNFIPGILQNRQDR